MCSLSSLRIADASNTAHLDTVERGYEKMDHYKVDFRKERKALRSIDFIQGKRTGTAHGGSVSNLYSLVTSCFNRRRGWRGRGCRGSCWGERRGSGCVFGCCGFCFCPPADLSVLLQLRQHLDQKKGELLLLDDTFWPRLGELCQKETPEPRRP